MYDGISALDGKSFPLRSPPLFPLIRYTNTLFTGASMTDFFKKNTLIASTLLLTAAGFAARLPGDFLPYIPVPDHRGGRSWHLQYGPSCLRHLLRPARRLHPDRHIPFRCR